MLPINIRLDVTTTPDPETTVTDDENRVTTESSDVTDSPDFMDRIMDPNYEDSNADPEMNHQMVQRGEFSSTAKPQNNRWNNRNKTKKPVYRYYYGYYPVQRPVYYPPPTNFFSLSRMMATQRRWRLG